VMTAVRSEPPGCEATWLENALLVDMSSVTSSASRFATRRILADFTGLIKWSGTKPTSA
jgi:hypothetical protein